MGSDRKKVKGASAIHLSDRKVWQYVGGCTKHLVLLTREEHEKLHRDSLNAVKNQFKGAIVHDNGLLDNKNAYWLITRRLSWEEKVKQWETAPIKVKFD